MIAQNKILAVIPARKGSKRLPEKNVKNFYGKPLIAWTIEAALNSKYIDKVILSSDDPTAIEIALSQGCEVPFIRPDHLASDDASSLDVIRHSIDFLKPQQYDYVILLQPTSPLRVGHDIDAALEAIIEKNAQVCISFCQSEKPLSWYCLYEQKAGLKKVKDEKENSEIICYPNGAIYIFSTHWLRENTAYQPQDVIPYFMTFDRSIDIDTLADWQLAEYFKCQQELD